MSVLLKHAFLYLCLFSLTINANAEDFLAPDQAFAFSSEETTNALMIHWEIEAGYYLYKSKVSAFYDNPDEKIQITFLTTSQIKQDKNFGEVDVFFEQAKARIKLEHSDNRSINIEYQGCSKKGLCYPPQIKTIALAQMPRTESKDINQDFDLSTLPSDVNSISRFLSHSDFITTIAIFLLLGIGLSFTPCILPMIPILSGIIVGQGEKLTAKHGAMLSTSYVLGMSVTYALAGIAAATFGAQGNLQMYMQNPWVISAFALVFVALSLSMFGVYTLSLPISIQNKLHNASSHQKGGHLSGVFIMGALSALIVSPCVSAPLAGALVFISSTGDRLIGGGALFALGIGMGLPLIAIGAGGGKFIPKAGLWMNQVKNFFGVVLLAVAIWLLSRIIPGPVSLILWALLLITYAIYSGALEPVEEGLSRLKKAAHFMLFLYGCALFIGGLSHANNPLKPLEKLSDFSKNNASALASTELAETKKHNLFTVIKNEEELKNAIANANNNNKPVFIDFYADWCASCVEMEKSVFSRTDVKDALQDYSLLQIDITNNSKEDQALLSQYGVFGPPAMVMINKQGLELPEYRVMGELNSNAFIAHINKANLNCKTDC